MGQLSTTLQLLSPCTTRGTVHCNEKSFIPRVRPGTAKWILNILRKKKMEGNWTYAQWLSKWLDEEDPERCLSHNSHSEKYRYHFLLVFIGDGLMNDAHFFLYTLWSFLPYFIKWKHNNIWDNNYFSGTHQILGLCCCLAWIQNRRGLCGKFRPRRVWHFSCFGALYYL